MGQLLSPPHDGSVAALPGVERCGDASALVFPLGGSHSVATLPLLAASPTLSCELGHVWNPGHPLGCFALTGESGNCLGSWGPRSDSTASGASIGRVAGLLPRASLDSWAPWGRNMRRALRELEVERGSPRRSPGSHPQGPGGRRTGSWSWFCQYPSWSDGQSACCPCLVPGWCQAQPSRGGLVRSWR